jgi:isoleucyl-tRNA synthetase
VKDDGDATNARADVAGSVHLAEFPVAASVKDIETGARWERIFEVRDVVLRALEEARVAKVIGSGLKRAWNSSPQRKLTSCSKVIAMSCVIYSSFRKLNFSAQKKDRLPIP